MTAWGLRSCDRFGVVYLVLVIRPEAWSRIAIDVIAHADICAGIDRGGPRGQVMVIMKRGIVRRWLAEASPNRKSPCPDCALRGTGMAIFGINWRD